MLVTLSENKLSNVVRQLEGINDSVEEISERGHHYFRRLFAEISKYGVHMVHMVSQQGGLGVFRFALDELPPVYERNDEGQQSTRIAGLQMMNPNSVTVESGDLAGLVPQGVILTTLQDEWDRYAHSLQCILPTDIPGALESAAQKMVLAPSTADFGDAANNEEYFQDWLRRSGKTDPSRRSQAVDEFNRREIEAYDAAQRAAVDKEWHRED